MAQIINVPPQALPSSGEANHLSGIVVGIEHVPESVNSKGVRKLLDRGDFDPSKVDSASRARVVAFQSWVGVGDVQVLIKLTDGTVFSIDHGECFGATSPLSNPTLTVATIEGVPGMSGRSADS